jgi:hypothetical protein
VVGLHLLGEVVRARGSACLLGQSREPVEVACAGEHELLGPAGRGGIEQRYREPGDGGQRERRQHDEQSPTHYYEPPSR